MIFEETAFFLTKISTIFLLVILNAQKKKKKIVGFVENDENVLT